MAMPPTNSRIIFDHQNDSTERVLKGFIWTGYSVGRMRPSKRLDRASTESRTLQHPLFERIPDHQNDSTERVLKVFGCDGWVVPALDHQNDSTERVLKVVDWPGRVLGLTDHQNDSTERVLKALDCLNLPTQILDHQNDSTERVLKDADQERLLCPARRPSKRLDRASTESLRSVQRLRECRSDHQNDSTERVLKAQPHAAGAARTETIKTTRQSEY